MLIINADDFGRNEVTTDNIIGCHAARRITSTSAMVFMADSERAAEIAQKSGMDVGLHINLSETFTARSLYSELREHHGRVCRFLRRSKYALLVYHPALTASFNFLFQAQRAEFLRLYEQPPSHYDGHQHMHLAANMLFSHILPKGARVRRSFSFLAGEKGIVNRFYRAMVDRRLARHHHLTDYFLSLEQHKSPSGLQRIVSLAQSANVELMTHPGIAAEYDFIMSDPYRSAFSGVRQISFSAL